MPQVGSSCTHTFAIAYVAYMYSVERFVSVYQTEYTYSNTSTVWGRASTLGKTYTYQDIGRIPN
jgi:hypothetical protein